MEHVTSTADSTAHTLAIHAGYGCRSVGNTTHMYASTGSDSNAHQQQCHKLQQGSSLVLTSPTTDAAKPVMASRPTKTSFSLVKPSSKPAGLLLLLVGALWLILGACRNISKRVSMLD
jgi:hypothetical protein